MNYAGKYKFEEFLNSGPVRRISRNLKTGYHTTAKQAAKTEKIEKVFNEYTKDKNKKLIRSYVKRIHKQ